MLAARAPDAPALTYREVAVRGGAVRIAVAGQGSALMLLHGWTLDHRMWMPQVAQLADRHTLVLPDRRGSGGSSAPPDLAREAEDVIAIADALGFARFALMGLSRGAVVALDTAHRFGSRLTALIVSGAPLPALAAREEVIDLDRYRALAAAGDLAQLRKEWAQHPLMRTHAPEAALLAAAMLADYDGRDLRDPSPVPAISHAALAMLSMPVMSMTGEHDTPWRRACARALAAAAPRAVHCEIAGAGHLANADNPDGFNAAVAQFLSAEATP